MKTLPAPYSRYQINSDGTQIKDTKRNKFIKIQENRKSGKYVALCATVVDDKGKRYFTPVARLVLMAYHGMPEGDNTLSRHLNGDQFDNRIENLAWGTARENAIDSLILGEKPIKLTPEQAIEVYALANHTDIRQTDIGKRYGISQRQVSAIKLGKKWSYFTKEYDEEYYRQLAKEIA